MEGLARCSRPFALPSGGARLVTMQLGPGYVRGDRFAWAGSVGAGAELAMTAQAATRALGHGSESVATTRWHVGIGATLRLVGEPLVLYENARHRATTEVELEPGGTLVYVDVIVARGAFSHVATRLRVRAAERLLLQDALALSPERLTGAVGSAFVVRAADSAPGDAGDLATADAAAYEARCRYGVRVGVGRPAGAGLTVRAVGDVPSHVHATLLEVLAAFGI